jgi:hypothetical protein
MWKDCPKGQDSRLQNSFSMGWFELWLTFHSRSWWPHFTSGCGGSRHALTVMENMWNKHSLIQKTSVEFQWETEMLRGGVNTLYIALFHIFCYDSSLIPIITHLEPKLFIRFVL